MIQEIDKSWQSNDTPNSQAHSGMKVGSELDFAHIMNTVGQRLLATSEGWKFRYVNQAFAHTVCKPLEDLIGKSIEDFIIPEDLDILALLGNLAVVEIIRKRSSNALEGQLK